MGRKERTLESGNSLLAFDEVDINCKDDRGYTPLSMAANYGHKRVVGLLLASEKVQPNVGNDLGQSPLWLALRRGEKGVVDLLLKSNKVSSGSELSDDLSWMPLSWTVENGNETQLALLSPPLVASHVLTQQIRASYAALD